MPTVYDRYARTKGWKALEALPGRALQSAELNEMQSIINDERAQLAQTLLSEGSVLSGMELIIDGTTATLTAGQVYAAGFFHDFVQASITITGVGEETIGVKVTQNQITEGNDPTLMDPAQGFVNFGNPGAYRTTFTLTIALNDSTALPLYVLRDGVIISGPQSPDLSELYKILARRTNDESGHYMVWGLLTSIEARDATTFSLVTDAGKAYVSGFERDIVATQRAVVDRPLDTRAILSEAKTYQTGTDLYELNGKPIKDITRVAGIVQANVSINRGGTPGGADLMPLTPVTEILSVVQGATTFVEGADYLVSGDNIDWSPAGAEPSTGTTYDVTLRYVKQMVEDADWQKTGDSVDFSLAGDNPVTGTVFNVDYNRYMPRYDILVMTQDGTLVVIKGESELFPIPPQKPIETLLLATIYYPANSLPADVVVTNSELYRQTFEELAELKDRIQTLEYNQLVTDLEQDAINVDLPSAKLGIFTDAFRDQTKNDMGHVDYSAAIDRRRQELSPSFSIDFYSLFTLSTLPDVVVGNHSHVLLFSQTYATHTTNVNPFATFGAGRISLTPPDDAWIETVKIFIDNREIIPGHEFEFWDELRNGVGPWADWEHVRANHWRRVVITDVSVEEHAFGFSRPLTVTVNGKQFTPNADNLELKFDGTIYTLTPWDPLDAGSNVGTVQADGDGEFNATFDIPGGLAAGTKLVEVSNNNNRAINQFAIGHIKRTTTIRRDITSIDPIAQSFLAPDNMFVSKVDLYFSAKDGTLPVVVSIRNMVNGFPGPDILAETVLKPADVQTSADAQTATSVVFARPAFVQSGREYCVVIATESTNYVVYFARLRGRDIFTNDVVTSNPSIGVMFESSNARTWSPRQDADLKMKLYRAEFTASRVLDFTALFLPGNAIDGSLLYLMADQVVPGNSRMIWEYSTDGGTTYKKIEPNITVDTGATFTMLKCRATMISSDNRLLSPILAIPPGAIVVKWNANGSYIGRNTELSAFTDLTFYADTNVPSGTVLTMLYSTDAGATWQSAGAATFVKAVTSEFSEHKWAVSGLANPTKMMARIDMTSNGAQTVVPKARRLRMIAT